MRKRCASWSGRRRWSPSPMRTTAVCLFFFPCVVQPDMTPRSSSPSVLPSRDARYMDRHFFHVRSVHGLVAEFHPRNLELVTGAPGIFRPSGTRDVLHRLVMNAPAGPSFLCVDLRIGKIDRSWKKRSRTSSDA
jgi:hypothetical protein